MPTPSPEELQKEFNSVRNKQVEIFDRLGQRDTQISQLTERMRKVDHLVARLENNSPGRPP